LEGRNGSIGELEDGRITQSDLLDTLCEATLLITKLGNLQSTLQRIVDAARELVQAEYAVLDVSETKYVPHAFFYSGVDEETAAKIPHQPEAFGLLGVITDDRIVVRLADLREDPRHVGFPEAHPPMRSFLGVPIVSEDEVYGRLYLTNKRQADEFSPLDEQLLTILAAHAAVSIRNARFMKFSQEQHTQLVKKNRQLAALDEATMAIAGELSLEKVLQQIVDSARELVGAQYAALGVPNSAGVLETFINSGMEPETIAGIPHLPHGLGLLGAIIKERRIIRIPRISDDPRSVGFPEGHPAMDPFLGVPVMAGGEMLGNLYLTNKIGVDEFTQEDEEMVSQLAAHAAVAIQNARLYEQVGRLAIVDERTRIGMDLHDGVIQSIYAVGLTLESTRLAMQNDLEDADVLLEAAIEGLNNTIRDIRNFILDLRPQRYQGNLEQGLGRLMREFQANTMTPVDFSIQSEVLEDVSTAVGRAVFLTTQEALANIARHARASQVEINIEGEADTLILSIKDDGVGFDVKSKHYSVGHGLSNMRARAEDLNGVFQIHSTPGEGTSIKLILPV